MPNQFTILDSPIAGTPVTTTPVAMAANVGNATIQDYSANYLDVSGALTAAGALTLALPAHAAQITFDNATTGGFPLVVNATYTIPPGRSLWQWNGATLEEVVAGPVINPVVMVANAATLNIPAQSLVMVDVTGALTANGNITTTFPANGAVIVFDNATTGAFQLQLNAGAYTLPFGKSIWYWNGATLELAGGAMRSVVQLNTNGALAAGYGSVNTAIRRFVNTVLNQGNDITYADSATLGASFTINSSGIYAITHCDSYASAAQSGGISLNSANLTTNINALPAGEVLAIDTGNNAGVNMSATWVGYLAAGSVIRPHGTPVGNTGTSAAQFTIARIS